MDPINPMAVLNVQIALHIHQNLDYRHKLRNLFARTPKVLLVLDKDEDTTNIPQESTDTFQGSQMKQF